MLLLLARKVEECPHALRVPAMQAVVARIDDRPVPAPDNESHRPKDVMVRQNRNDLAVPYADGLAWLQDRHRTLVHAKVELAGFVEVPQHLGDLCAAVQGNADVDKRQEADMVDVSMTQKDSRDIAWLKDRSKLLFHEICAGPPDRAPPAAAGSPKCR